MGLWALRNKEYTEKIEHQNVNVSFVTVLGRVNPLRSIIKNKEYKKNKEYNHSTMEINMQRCFQEEAGYLDNHQGLHKYTCHKS